MTRSPEHQSHVEHYAPDQHQRLVDAIEERGGKPDISVKYLQAMAVALTAGYNRYGDPAKSSYHEFHNDTHFFNVATGSWRVLDFMRDGLQLDVQTKDYVVGGLIGTLHDIVHEAAQDNIPADDTYLVDFGGFSVAVHNDGTKSDEKLSAEAAVLYLGKLGMPKDIQRRVRHGILLTEVSFETGTPVQKGAGKGGRDYGAIAAAIADTEGIFGGEERLSKDVARLVSEALEDNVNDEGLVTTQINKFIESEVAFVRQKIAEFVLHILGTEDSPEQRQALNDKLARSFAPYEEKALAAAAFFDTGITNIQQRHDHIHAHIQTLQQHIQAARSQNDKPHK